MHHAAVWVAVWLACVLASGCAGTVVSSPESGAAPARQVRLDLARLLSAPSPTGVAPSAPTWSPDGRRLAFRWQHPAGVGRELWLVEADGSGLRPLTQQTEGLAGVGEFAWLPDARGVVYLRGDSLWRTDLDGGSELLARIDGDAGELGVSPDGRFVSWLQDGDLWWFDRSSGERTRRTAVGVPPISKVPIGRYRRAEVEIGPYVWGGPSYAWAPDGRTLAVHHVDRRAVRAVPFPHYLGDETDANFVRRSYPGDPNEARRVALLAVDGGELRFLDLPDPTANRIVDFAWSRDGRLLVDRESDTAVDRWLDVVDPATGARREVFRDRRETRVYTTCGSAWHPDGRHVLVLGDIADRYGIYALDLAEVRPQPRLLTNPLFDVTDGPFVAADGAVFYASNEPSPHEQHVFRTGLERGEPIRLTRLPGEARPYPSPDGRHVALLRSDDVSPTELWLVDAAGSAPERRVTHSAPAEFAGRAWAKARYVSFPSHVDGATLHARVLEPRSLEPGRRYPVLVGPVYSNTVRNRWAGFWSLFQQLLVDEGYVVVQVDVRGSTGYGRAFREQFLADFAGRDLDDLESAVRYVEGLPHVDPDRIGVFGSSYGGTLTVYALLTKPGLFDAGVACAAAVDPRFFGSDDVAIVRRPDSHPAAFLRGAAAHAANLEAPLLLIHGMQDQVVPFKTVVDLAEALMRAGKDFDFAFAPAGSHGWTSPPHYARFLLGKLLAHFDRHLRGPRPPNSVGAGRSLR
jgi:dipeptidyl-peptidase 4